MDPSVPPKHLVVRYVAAYRKYHDPRVLNFALIRSSISSTNPNFFCSSHHWRNARTHIHLNNTVYRFVACLFICLNFLHWSMHISLKWLIKKLFDVSNNYTWIKIVLQLAIVDSEIRIYEKRQIISLIYYRYYLFICIKNVKHCNFCL